MDTFRMLIKLGPPLRRPTCVTSGTCFTSTSACCASTVDSARVTPGLSRMPISKVPSLNGGRKVVGKNGTAAAAIATATAPAVTAALGCSSTLQRPAITCLEPGEQARVTVIEGLHPGKQVKDSTGVTVTETTNEASVETMNATPSGTNSRPSMPGSANSGKNTSTMMIVA